MASAAAGAKSAFVVETVASSGGGRGVYAAVDGDVPLALFAKMTPDLAGQAEVDDNAAGHSVSVETHSDQADVGGVVMERFVALTWNACGMEAGFIDDVIIQLGEASRWDCLCIQEGPYVENVEYQILESGHLFFLTAFHCFLNGRPP